MSPNPMVAMAAPAPEPRYAPRELPRVGSRNEGRAFEERISKAESSPRLGSKSKGAAESKSKVLDLSAEASKAETPKPEPAVKLPEPAAEAAIAVAVPGTSVTDLASMSVLAPPAPPEAPLADPQTPVEPQATQVPAVVAERPAEEPVEQPVEQPVVASAIIQTAEPQVKPQAKPQASKTETPTTPVAETDEAEPAEAAKPVVPVKPVAQQGVPSSLEGLRAVKGLTSLRESLDGAPRTETSRAAVKPEFRPMPASLDQVTASVVDAEAPEASSVKPWEIAEPVRTVADASAVKTEVATIKAEPVPVKEAITRTFVQVQKTPDRPAELKLQLNPEHLGRMQLRVQAHEGVVSAVIRVEHAGVRDLVENQLAALRTSLAEQGIKIDRLEVSVNQQGPRDQQAAAGFDFGRQAFGQEPQRDPSGRQSPPQSQASSWEAWSVGASDEPLPSETPAASGFDTQA